jgi:hypothetical protein
VTPRRAIRDAALGFLLFASPFLAVVLTVEGLTRIAALSAP